MLVENGYLIMRLVKLWSKDDFVPNGKAHVVIEQFVGQGWLRFGIVGGFENILEPLLDIASHLAAINVHHLAVLWQLEKSHYSERLTLGKRHSVAPLPGCRIEQGKATGK
jgi:hypothetical protein